MPRRLVPLALFLPSVALAQPSDAPSEPVQAVEPTPYEQCLARRKELATAAQANPDLNERARQLRALPDCSGNAPPPAPVVTTTPLISSNTGTDTTGVMIEARLDTAYIAADDLVLSGVQPGVFVGYYAGAFSLGVGLELSRTAQSASSGDMEMDASQNAFLFLFGARFRLARKGDTELAGLTDLGVGSSWTSDSTSTSDAPDPVRIRVQVGLAPRHWLTPSFAIGGAIGLRYDRAMVSAEIAPGVTVDQAASATAMFSSLQMIAVF